MKRIRNLTLVDLLLIGSLGYFIYWFVNRNLIHIEFFTTTYNKYIIYTFFISFILYRYVLQELLFKMLFMESYPKVNRNIVQHYNIGIFGKIGTRKSANMTAITQIAERIIIDNMEERLYKINLLLSKFIDFADFNEYFFNYFDWKKVHTEAMYKEFSGKYFMTRNMQIGVTKLYVQDNSFSEETIITLLAEYVEYMYYKYFRNNYIQANSSVLSINTEKMALPMKESTFQFFRENDRAYEKCLITNKDEAAIVDNSRMNANVIKEENQDGKDIENVIQRHGGKGTNLRLTAAQSEKDVTANRRRLFNRSIELYAPQDQFLYNTEMNLIKSFANYLMKKELKKYNKKMKKFRRLNKRYQFFKWNRLLIKSERVYRKYEHYLVKRNNYKKILLLLERIHIALGKHLYCVQYMFLHDDSSNIGKNAKTLIENGSSIPMFIVYPAGITFGKYSTYSYFRLFDERNRNATVSLATVKPFKKLTMTREEHLSMGFEAINKITERMENAEEIITSTPQVENTSKIDYSLFE